ncbi:MAG: sodium:solute symporter family protein [Deltaproteobacteria bacterium]|nr:sodium:solute symporter family protein [Deltaproteobacteria bacterium]
MSGITWVYIMLGIYVVYAFWQGLQGFFAEKTSAGYAIGGRSVPFIAFLMAATAASFSGWTFIGHPGLIWRDGLAYAFASFYVLTIPISGTFFAKRQWLLGKRYGFITPGDMYAYFFNSEPLRFLVVATALLYSLFYSAVQMMASAALFQWVAGIDFVWGAWIMAFIVWFYVCTGGMKASAWVGVFQFVFLVGGIVLLGYYVINRPEFGGWAAFSATVGKLNKSLLEVPSVIFFTSDAGAYAKANKTVIWTAVMCLTYMFSLMGIQSSPAFTMNFFGIKSPKVLGWQQAFMSTFVVGFALFYFTAIQGMGAKVLEISGILKFTKDSDVVPILMANYLPPFVLGVVFLGAIAAIHSTAAPYINTGGSILLRDVWWRYIRKQKCGHAEQIWMNRLFATILTIAAVMIGLNSKAALVILGALATAFGFVMYVLLVGVCWGFRFPSIGAVLGVLTGMIAVFLTYYVWPNLLSMHCAFWGGFTGIVVAYLCRGLGLKDKEETIKRQNEIRTFLDSIDAPSESAKKWRGVMKIGTPLWYFFAIGPACILGNTAFSFAGFPPLWSWQIAWWIIGIVMMWALCFKCELATTTEVQLQRAEKETMIVVKEA